MSHVAIDAPSRSHSPLSGAARDGTPSRRPADVTMRRTVREMHPHVHVPHFEPTPGSASPHSAETTKSRRRQGKAPPIEFFSGEDSSVLLDDWLPSLERASAWNGWSTDDKLMQLPGYLRGEHYKSGVCFVGRNSSPTPQPSKLFVHV